MAERTERAVINDLIETCRDAERGFRMAAEHVNTPEMKGLFVRLAQQRHEFADALLPYAHRLGGATDGDGTGIAAVHRTWMQFRARLASNPERAMLEEALRGERHALAVYEEAVHDVLPPDARELVETQDLGVRVAGRLMADLATH
ncbi:MAG: PA2169 family four-helix-bundle protein [Acidobacteria bacterium]|nr:PA2169 family four-helix-bundle protein [Acidobacteriota bacterium]